MICTDNEFDNLKTIIVGTATNAHWPKKCKIFRQLEKTSLWTKTKLPAGPVADKIIEEANEDLENLTKCLEKLNVTVYRPKDLDFASFDGLYNYCPRDRILIIGRKVIDAPMLFPTRYKEIDSIKHLLPDNIIKPTDEKIIFDAANISRVNKDIFYLCSSTANLYGAHYLQNILGEKYKVHCLKDIYSGVHIDSTIIPLNENLILINGDRITHKNMPAPLKKYDIISIKGEEIIPQDFVLYPYASKYIALNLLSVNPNLVICDPKQDKLRNKLQKKGIDSIGIELRHSRTLGGGHHCVTLDLERTNVV